MTVKISDFNMQTQIYIPFRSIEVDEAIWKVKAESCVQTEMFSKYESELGIIYSLPNLFHDAGSVHKGVPEDKGIQQ